MAGKQSMTGSRTSCPDGNNNNLVSRKRGRKRAPGDSAFACLDAANSVHDSTSCCAVGSRHSSSRTQTHGCTDHLLSSNAASSSPYRGVLRPGGDERTRINCTRAQRFKNRGCRRGAAMNVSIGSAKGYSYRCSSLSRGTAEKWRRNPWQGRTLIILVSILLCLICNSTTDAQHYEKDSTLTPPSYDDKEEDHKEHHEDKAAAAADKKGDYDDEWAKKDDKWAKKKEEYYEKLKLASGSNEFYKGCLLYNAGEEKVAGMKYDASDHDLLHIHNHRHGIGENHGHETEEHDHDMDKHSQHGHNHDDKASAPTHDDDDGGGVDLTIEHSHAHGDGHHNTTIDHFREKAGYYKRRHRVCNSDDSPEAVQLGMCRKLTIERYMEIRIFAQPWESVSKHSLFTFS